jgi:hypothetical protein
VASIDELHASLAEVTADDVDRVIERVLGGPRVLAVVGPFSEDDFTKRR